MFGLHTIRIALTAAVVATTATGAHADQIKKDFILYSYDRIIGSGGAVREVLVPRIVSLTGEDVEFAWGLALFESLKADKGQNYGQAKLVDTPEERAAYEKTGVFAIVPDPDKAGKLDLMLAEVIYTLTELGAKGVKMFGSQGKPLTRDNVVVAAYALVLPLWQALPPYRFLEAVVRMSDGEHIGVPALKARIARSDAKITVVVTSLLKAPEVAKRIAAVRALREVKLATALDDLTMALRAKERDVRLAAVETLAFFPSARASQALTESLENDEDDGVRFEVATVMAAMPDTSAKVTGLKYFLSSTQVERKAKAIESLKANPFPEARPHLLPLLKDSEPKIRKATVEALIASVDDSVRDALNGVMTSDTEAEVREAAAEGLIRAGGKSHAILGWIHRLQKADAERARAAAERLGTLGDDRAREALEAALSHADVGVKKAAARAIGLLSRASSIPALAKAAKDSENTEAPKVLERLLAKQPTKDLLVLLKDPDAGVRRMVAHTLGTSEGRLSAESLPALAALQQDADAEVRHQALETLSKASGKESQDAMFAAARDKDAKVRKLAAEGLGKKRGDDVKAQLLQFMEDEDDTVRAAAAGALVAAGDEGVVAPLSKLAKIGNVSLRRQILRAIARHIKSPEKEFVQVLIDLVYDEDAECREHAIRALATAKDARVNPTLVTLLKDQAAGVRSAALASLAKIAKGEALVHFVEALTDEVATVRLAALDAIAGVHGKSAKAAVERLASSDKDKAVRARAKQVARRL